MKYNIGRNDPCPCGSGKKYKKCCGAISGSMPPASKQEPDYFMINKEIAYKGRVGRQRREFCISFIGHKKERIKELTGVQLEAVAARGERISCQKGCYLCCSAYVEATLQECEAIVYYLYQNERVLESFLRTYPQWRERVRKNGDLFKSCGRFWKEEWTPETARELMLAHSEEEERYMRQNIPCPFLDNGLCSIYEVRPYMCVAVIAVSPPEWCDLQHPNEPVIYKAMPIEVRNDYSFYYRNLERFVITNMPIAVYEILKNGTYYLSAGKVPTLKDLDYEFLTDPEVVAILRRHGVLDK
jgi:Fe-S-cluster containining protein